MTHRTNHSGLVASRWLAGLVLVCATVTGCSSDKKPPAAAPAPAAPAAKPMAGGGVTRSRMMDVEPGVAGGIVEDTATLSVKVVDVDRATRKVTLADDAGNRASFIAGSEIRNLDQLHPGDKVTATLKERLVVFVRPAGAGEEAGATYAAALAAAPKGAKPGALVAESYEVVATVSEIDAAKRIATLKFADGSTRPVQVRPDVDLARYKVGDNVIIRVTAALLVVAATP